MFSLIPRHQSSLSRVHLLFDVLLFGMMAASSCIFVISELPVKAIALAAGSFIDSDRICHEESVANWRSKFLLKTQEIYRELLLQNNWRRIANVRFVYFASLWKKLNLLCTFRPHLPIVIAENDDVGESSYWTEGIADKRHLLEFLLVAIDHWLQYDAWRVWLLVHGL